jgi:hypothetical protein
MIAAPFRSKAAEAKAVNNILIFPELMFFDPSVKGKLSSLA